MARIKRRKGLGPLRGAKNFLGRRPSQVLRTSFYSLVGLVLRTSLVGLVGLARRTSFNSLRARSARPTETKSLAFRKFIGLKASKSSRRLFLGSAPGASHQLLQPLLDWRRCSSKELAHRGSPSVNVAEPDPARRAAWGG